MKDERFDILANLPERGSAAQVPEMLQSPSGDGASTVSDPSGGSTIFKNMERLSLKLERTKLPAEVLVFDHLEKVPTEN